MDDQFVLASNTLNSNQIKPPTLASVQYTTNTKQSNRLVTSVPGVGITFYDANDQTPLSSLTLGPSFRPTTAPVSRSTPSSSKESVRVESSRKTWLGVESAEGHQVWAWIEEERKDGSTEGEAHKLSFPTSDKLVALAAPRTLPTHLILLSANGTLSLNSEASLTHLVSLPQTLQPPASQSLQVFSINPSAPSPLIPSSILSFLSTPSKAHLVILTRTFATSTTGDDPASLVEISQKPLDKKKKKRPSSVAVIEEAERQAESPSAGGETTEIEVVLVDPEVMSEGITNAGVVSLGKVAVNGKEVVVSEDGFVTVLGPKGTLDSFRLSIPESAPLSTYAELYSNDDPADLVLTPIKSLPLSPDTISLAHTSLLALHSSFVILATVRLPAPKAVSTALSTNMTDDASPSITAIVWDTRLGAVVSANTITVPSAVFPTAATSKDVQLSLNKLSTNMASLSIAPKGGAGGRSVIFILPLLLPTSSVLVAVIGKSELTQKYLVSTGTIVSKAKKAEPIRHPKTSERKLALLKESEKNRADVLEELQKILSGLEKKKGMESDKVVREAEVAFEKFVEKGNEALREYNAKKLAVALEKERERREAALLEKAAVQSNSNKYRSSKKLIEAAVSKAEAEGQDWKEVTSTRIKGVSDVHRYYYYDQRKSAEVKKEMEVDDVKLTGLEKAMEKQKIALPSSFVTALVKLCFPKPVESASDLVTPSSTESSKHPISIVSYLLERQLLADSILEGGLTSYLARAGDWTNVEKALVALPDIAETTSVVLLRSVVRASTTPSATPSLSSPPPLKSFLTSFVESPTTPTLLRQALQQHLNADEVLPVLIVLDQWLAWWAMRGGGGGEVLEEGTSDWKAAGKPAPKRLPSNPFVALTVELKEDEQTPPRVEDILPLVQAILDAHFVNLLLQRRAHSLLRRLSAHIAAHVAISNDLSTLLGALSVYARTKEEQKQARAAQEAEDDYRRSMSRKGRHGANAKSVAAKDQQKSFGASMAARIAAQEKHNEVGAYEVDRFVL